VSLRKLEYQNGEEEVEELLFSLFRCERKPDDNNPYEYVIVEMDARDF
jgi:hypothetical protein